MILDVLLIPNNNSRYQACQVLFAIGKLCLVIGIDKYCKGLVRHCLILPSIASYWQALPQLNKEEILLKLFSSLEHI